MAYKRKYEDYEVRALLKNAEGVASPVTGAPAHSRSLHAQSLQGGDGISEAALVARVDTTGLSNAQKKKVPSASSMFPNLVMQSAAAVQALNSTTGQAALATFDDPANATKLLRMTLQMANIKEAGFLEATAAPTVTYVNKGNGPVAQTTATTGVRLIIDRDNGANSIFIQTCIPLNTPGAGSSWEVKDWGTKAVLASG
jgi:hypothetical protein